MSDKTQEAGRRARIEYYKAMAKAKRLEKATTIQDAIDFFIDKECLRCGAFPELPTLENIQNWLEENGQ